VKAEIHPAVKILKEEITRTKAKYPNIAYSTKIPVQRLKNIMSGRTQITMFERDLLCAYLHISPFDILVRRDDLFGIDTLDLRVLPGKLRLILVALYNELIIANKTG
jgi:hypothetical protein